MGLIFMYLVESVQYVEMRLPNQYENMISMTTLDYIEQKYRTATLTELCDQASSAHACTKQDDQEKHRI